MLTDGSFESGLLGSVLMSDVGSAGPEGPGQDPCRPGGTGGISRDERAPAKFLWGPRGFRWLRACTRSTSGETGRRKGARGRSGACIRGGARRRLIAAAKESVDLPLQIRKRTGGCRPSRIDHDVPRCRQFREAGSHHFANAPFEAIADHGLADGAGRGEADTRSIACVGQAECGKERPAMAEAVVIYFAEFAGS
jgi:hypothetical protein